MNLLAILNRAAAPDAAEKRQLRKTAADEAPYPAGYCKPPETHRFRKGQSGNPRGRPRKVEAVGEVLTPLPKMSAQEMLIAEAYRMVRVRDGRKRVEMPAIQAAFRELSMAAARGDRLALNCMAQLVFRIEAKPPAAAPVKADVPEETIEEATGNPNGEEWWFDETTETWSFHPDPDKWLPGSVDPSLAPDVIRALDYKTAWALVLKAAESHRVDVTPPVPHPDEIVVDRARGTVSYTGRPPEQPLSLGGLRALVKGLRADLEHRREVSEREKWIAYGPEHKALCGLSGLTHALEGDLQACLGCDAPAEEANAVAPPYRIVADPAAVIKDRSVSDNPPDAVGNRDAGVVGHVPKPEMPALDPVDAERVAEAQAYTRMWRAALDEAARLKVPLEPPVPHPDEVEIDPVAGTVTYRVAIEEGEGATLERACDGMAQLRAFETRCRQALCFTDSSELPEAQRRHANAKQVYDTMVAAWCAWRHVHDPR